MDHLSNGSRLFFAELARTWTPRRRLQVLLGVAAALGLQTLFTYLVFILPTDTSTQQTAGYLGLYGALPNLFLPRMALFPSPWPGHLATAVLALPVAAFHFVVPACAALSIAPDRKHHRIEELLAEGLTPRQILLAKGLAAVFPFLVLGLVGLAAAWCGYLASGAITGTAVPGGLLALRTGRWAFQSLVSLPVGWTLRCLLMVSISALCRRVYGAITACYVVEFVALPLLRWVLDTWYRGTFNPGFGDWRGWLVPFLAGAVVQAVVVALLAPRALRVITASAPPAYIVVGDRTAGGDAEPGLFSPVGEQNQ